MVVLPLEEATELLGSSGEPLVVLEGVLADLAKVAGRDPVLAAGALAGLAVAMAMEVENPFNSATSKSMCANTLRETMASIREQLPAEQEKDEIDELRERRQRRRVGEQGT